MEISDFKQLKLVGDRVLIKPDPPKMVYSSGLIIPETMRTMPLSGVVVKAGKGTKNQPMKYLEGDRVIFPRAVRNSTWVINKVTYLFVMQQDIVAKIV